jgi:hypothetical protein
MISFMVVIALFMVGLVWIGEDSQRREIALAREVQRLNSDRTVHDLKRCFGRELRLSKSWKGAADEAGGVRGFNHMTDIGVVIHNRGDARDIAITTSKGRALRHAEIEAINECAAATT